jgi:predicted ArsR family transcriptional regulator
MAKADLLDVLTGGGEWTSAEIADSLGMAIVGASVALRRLHHQGLVTRRRQRERYGPPKLYCYAITAKGVDRLSFLRQELRPSAAAAVTQRAGVSGKDQRTIEKWITQRIGG